MVIGVTGGIASGKNLVAGFLAGLGAEIIDADEIGRQVVEPGSRLLEALASRWGNGILKSDGSLDRRALGERVFSHPQERLELEGLLHPPIIHEIKKRILESTRRVVVVMAPLLIESGALGLVDEIWLVCADESTQVERIMTRDRLDETAARLRLAAQMPLEEKRAHAQVVIDNNRTREDTHRQVMALWNQRVKPRLDEE